MKKECYEPAYKSLYKFLRANHPEALEEWREWKKRNKEPKRRLRLEQN